ncbi:MAG: hypothetical protein WKG07_26930 [Hymenobacter sp.]
MPLTLTHTQPAEPAAAAAKPRLAPPYRQEDVQFGNLPAKLQLAGTLTVPAGQGLFRPWCCSPMRARTTATARWATSRRWGS